MDPAEERQVASLLRLAKLAIIVMAAGAGIVSQDIVLGLI